MSVLFSDRLFLTGFMGAGKSTVGQQLAERLGCHFVDLDKLIEERAGKTITEIFADDGESHFRQLESEALFSLPVDRPGVYSTGGGIVTSPQNREFMQAAGRIVYLRAEWKTLQERLSGSTDRPLASPEKDWSTIRDLLESRIVNYEVADMIVDTDGKSVDWIVSYILETLNR